MNRRAYLSSVCVGTVSLLAGCSSGDGAGGEPTTEQTTEATAGQPTTMQTTTAPPDHEYAPDPWKNIEETNTNSSNTISGQATLEEGQYALRQAQFNRSYNIEVGVSVQDGGSIDIFGMSADEFDRYRDRESPVYYDGLYETGVSDTTISDTMQTGDHRIIFDNSSVFGSDASEEVTFAFETVVRVPE